MKSTKALLMGALLSLFSSDKPTGANIQTDLDGMKEYFKKQQQGNKQISKRKLKRKKK